MTDKKYIDAREFEAVQLPEDGTTALPGWVAPVCHFDGQYWILDTNTQYFVMLPGDYFCKSPIDGEILPMARDEFEKNCKPAGDAWQPIETAVKDIPTRNLQWELNNREGVTARSIGQCDKVQVLINGQSWHEHQGPLTVTINID